MNIKVPATSSASKFRRPLSYWLRVAVICAFGLWASDWLADNSPGWLKAMQVDEYQFLNSLMPGKPQLHDLAIVLIDDDDYYKGDLAHRKPLKRDYLGRLVTTLCASQPKLIALDIYTRSPVDGDPADAPIYKAETDQLFSAIEEASKTCKIVLARTLREPSIEGGSFTEETSVLDAYHFSRPENVRWGHISLPADIRKVPLINGINVKNKKLDSFSQAIVRADDPLVAAELSGDRGFPYGTFMGPERFYQENRLHKAADVLNGNVGIQELQHKDILVGVAWHENSFGVGRRIDDHVSPAGTMPGVFLHANYVAAMFTSGGTFNSIPKIGSVLFEILVVLCIARIFAIRLPALRRWLYLCGIVAAVALVTIVFRQNLGLYFEGTIPAVLVFAHGLFDESLKRNEEFSELRDEVHRLRSGVDAS